MQDGTLIATDYVFVLDVDGTVTTGEMVYSKDGKLYKVFGADDWDMLGILSNFAKIHFISADRKGFPITQRRIEEECNYPLDLISGVPTLRWTQIQQKYPNNYVIFMGDGVCDWYAMKHANYSITTSEAMDHVKKHAKYVTQRTGGKRAVAEACLHLMDKFGWRDRRVHDDDQ